MQWAGLACLAGLCGRLRGRSFNATHDLPSPQATLGLVPGQRGILGLGAQGLLYYQTTSRSSWRRRREDGRRGKEISHCLHEQDRQGERERERDNVGGRGVSDVTSVSVSLWRIACIMLIGHAVLP